MVDMPNMKMLPGHIEQLAMRIGELFVGLRINGFDDEDRPVALPVGKGTQERLDCTDRIFALNAAEVIERHQKNEGSFWKVEARAIPHIVIRVHVESEGHRGNSRGDGFTVALTMSLDAAEDGICNKVGWGPNFVVGLDVFDPLGRKVLELPCPVPNVNMGGQRVGRIARKNLTHESQFDLDAA
jgi:hypothetical protein